MILSIKLILRTFVDGLELKPEWAGLPAVGRTEFIRLLATKPASSIGIAWRRSMAGIVLRGW